MRWQSCALGLVLLTGCASSAQTPMPTPQAPAGTTVAAPSTPTPAPAPSASPTPPPAVPSPSASTASSQPPRPAGPLTQSLRYGQTARLRYFDVTALRQEFGQDGISIGWKVRVCYSAAHPQAGGDGRTRVSNNPWSVRVRDGEGGGGSKVVPISSLPHDEGWVPEFKETRLGVGECQEGWLPVKHQNPDLQWNGLIYAPTDFGDRITWT